MPSPPNHHKDARSHHLPLQVRLGQLLRRLIKATAWEPLTALPNRLGHPLQTVQVLVVDPKREKILLLRTAESKTGYFPVQGLRLWANFRKGHFGYSDDSREDARRELAEEAVATELALDEFHFLLRHRQGRHSQFDCQVYAVWADSERLCLLNETAEGLPLWLSFEQAGEVLGETLRDLLPTLQGQA